MAMLEQDSGWIEGVASFDKLRMRKSCACRIDLESLPQPPMLLMLSLSKDALELVQATSRDVLKPAEHAEGRALPAWAACGAAPA